MALASSVGPSRTQLRQAKIEHFDGAVRAHLDIRGLQITMDDAGIVRRSERVCDLTRDRSRLVDRDWPTRDPLRQVLAVDQFHDQDGGRRFGASRRDRSANRRPALQAIDLRDVRMIERCERLGFAFKPHHPIGVAGKRVGQNFDRDVAVESGIAGAIHLAHSAFAKFRDDLVGSDSRAGVNGHGRRVTTCPAECRTSTRLKVATSLSMTALSCANCVRRRSCSSFTVSMCWSVGL